MSNAVYINVEGGVLPLEVGYNAHTISDLAERDEFPVYKTEQEAISAGDAYHISNFNSFDWSNNYKDRVVREAENNSAIWAIIFLFDYLSNANG